MSFRRFFLQFMTLAVMTSLIIAGCSFAPPGDSVRTELVTVVIMITTTPDPDASPQVIIVTATPDRTQVNVPDGIVPATSAGGTAQFGVTPITTVDASAAETGLSAPLGCLVHTVDEGDTVFGIADEYGVNGFVMLEVNGLTEDTAFLDIGDELIVPIEGCPIEEIVPPTAEPLEIGTEELTEEATEELTEEATESANLTPSPSPTITLAPTAVDSEIEIVEVIRAGDVTAEGVRIRNNGRLVDVAGWTLSDTDGNEFVFDELLIFSNAEHTVYTRASENTPIASYWGLEEPVWQAGDVVTLTDDNGDVQAVLRISEDDEE